MSLCSLATAVSDLNSLIKPRPMLRATIVAMITASVIAPVAPEIAAAPKSRISSGLRSCRTKTSNAVTTRDARTLGPHVASLWPASAAVSPFGDELSARSTSSPAERAAHPVSTALYNPGVSPIGNSPTVRLHDRESPAKVPRWRPHLLTRLATTLIVTARIVVPKRNDRSACRVAVRRMRLEAIGVSDTW